MKCSLKYMIKRDILIFIVFTIFTYLAITSSNELIISSSVIINITIIAYIPTYAKYFLELNANILEQSFEFDYKFHEKDGIYYINSNGLLGVIYINNPTSLSYIKPTCINNIKIIDGNRKNKTSQIYVKFKINKRVYKIYILKSYRGYLSMFDEQVKSSYSRAKEIQKLLEKMQNNA